MSQPKPKPPGEKAPHPIAINDGTEAAGNGTVGAATAAGPVTPPHDDPGATGQPQAAPDTPDPPDPHLMVELATVEQMLARQQHAQARRELLVIAVAAAAFLLAAAAYRRTTVMDEGDE